MTTVIYHSADYDGKFCEAIARRFLGEEGVRYVGWNFGDAPIGLPINGDFVVMDLPLLEPFGLRLDDGWVKRGNEEFQKVDLIYWKKFTWIDHHKSSIESTPALVPGYRIDGVAACRLAWQWFTRPRSETCPLPDKQAFVDRNVHEPLAVRLAGEYDVWDKRDPDAELFQYGLRSMPYGFDIGCLLGSISEVNDTIAAGRRVMQYARNVDAGNMKASFLVEWEGLKFLALNGRGNSLTFASRDVRETGHDALLMFYTNGSKWVVSLYHARGREELDLSVIAKKMGGGGHRGACGFTCTELPFLK